MRYSRKDKGLTMNQKPMQDEEGNVVDSQTRKNQQGFDNYEREQSDAQRERDAKDERMIEKARKVKEKIKRVLPFKKGGSVSSASKRADGCAIKGKTKGRIV
jgi:hypothetical protein